MIKCLSNWYILGCENQARGSWNPVWILQIPIQLPSLESPDRERIIRTCNALSWNIFVHSKQRFNSSNASFRRKTFLYSYSIINILYSRSLFNRLTCTFSLVGDANDDNFHIRFIINRTNEWVAGQLESAAVWVVCRHRNGGGRSSSWCWV